MKEIIQITRSSMPDFNEYAEEIRDLWKSRLLTNSGVKHRQLENELGNYLNTQNISLFSNGHLALEWAIASLELSGEVITTPFTFASTTHAIVRNGLVPVFCDINYDNYTIDVNQIESLITEKTSAILPVHVFGNICDVYKIDKIARKYNLKVIYDAAHAFGVTVNGLGISEFGDMSMFSFHATKVFHTIEGGAIVFKNSDFKKKLNALKNFGITDTDKVSFVGGNAKMNEFQAAMGLCNLRHIDAELKKRKNVFDRYMDNLLGIEGIILPKEKVEIKNNYSYFPVVFDNFKFSRDEVHDVLKKNDIITRKYFYPLTSKFECYESMFNSNETPVAKWVSDRILTLPLFSDLTLESVDYICSLIKGKGGKM